MAAYTNGKVRPSLKPASEVSVNRSSSDSSTSWSPVCGPATWTSEASTGSVGASAAPSSSAAAGARPAVQPSSATRAIVTGMPIARSRHVAAHRSQLFRSRGLSGRSSARPTPIRATSTTSSVTCSMAARLVWGSSGRPSGSGVRPMSMPTPTSTIGAEIAHRARSSGSTIANSRLAPATRYTTSAVTGERYPHSGWADATCSGHRSAPSGSRTYSSPSLGRNMSMWRPIRSRPMSE